MIADMIVEEMQHDGMIVYHWLSVCLEENLISIVTFVFVCFLQQNDLFIYFWNERKENVINVYYFYTLFVISFVERSFFFGSFLRWVCILKGNILDAVFLWLGAMGQQFQKVFWALPKHLECFLAELWHFYHSIWCFGSQSLSLPLLVWWQ